MRTPEIVLLGGANSGKTHYAGQLYGRLRRRPGCLRLRAENGTPADLEPLEGVLTALANGCATEHTAASTWHEILLPLEDARGGALDLRWPDYGGEQLDAVFTHRTVSDPWRARLRRADAWVLMLRLQSEIAYDDILPDLTPQPSPGTKAEARGSFDGRHGDPCSRSVDRRRHTRSCGLREWRGCEGPTRG